MKKRVLANLLATFLLVFHQSCMAEDIDLFFNVSPKASQIPNVLFIVDNTANWNTVFEAEMSALAQAVSGLPAGKFRIGIMFSAETGNPNSSISGGYVRAAIRLMDQNTKPAYQALISSFDKLNDKGNGGDSSLVIAEAYRYFSGGTPYAGNKKIKADYAGNTTGFAASNAVYALPENALSNIDATKYVPPFQSECQKNFIIYLSNGPSQDNRTVISQSELMLTEAGGDKTVINLSPTDSQKNSIDEWARFMNTKSDIKIVTYAIDVAPGSTGQGPGWSAVLKSMGTGGYFAIQPGPNLAKGIEDAVNTILSEIQSVNTVFASVSLPVSVNTQGTYLNQVFIGMFRPDPDALPRWNGNLKQYKMGFENGDLKLLDSTGKGALNTTSGFITECAQSYWTPATADNYWLFRPQGGCLGSENSNASNSPDGNIVEKGAQAFKLRNTALRPVKTCSPGSCTDMKEFNSNNVTQTMLGATSSSEHIDLINWARGSDNKDENANTDTTEMRPSSHGDIVHSRPVAINFGTDIDPKVVVFYGGNDGMLRAVNGNRTNSIGTVEAGAELWAFMPPEFYRYIKRLRDNNLQISYKGPDAALMAGRLPKPYGVDGPVTAYKDGVNTSIFAGMRRGGRAYYALDVSNPAGPSIKWRQGCPNLNNDTGCDKGFDDIGQTWSSLKTLKSSGYGSGASPMLIAGGGYDICEDDDPNTCSSTKGNKIYVLDAETGALLKTFDTIRGVAADVFVVDSFTTGMAKYAYAVDMGGNVYRITIGTDHPSAWTITTIASLGCDSTASCTANRKFLFPPDIVDEDGVYVLLLGSGDREKPITSFTTAASVNNYYFMIKDKPTDTEWLTSEQANCGAQIICKNSLLALPVGNTAISSADLADKKGWYLSLQPTEQVVTSSITVFGTNTFSTHQPSVPTAGACSANLGTARAYNLDYATGTGISGNSRFEEITGGGLPPSPIAGRVTLDDGTTVPYIIGGGKLTLDPNVPPVPGVSIQPKSKVYWYISK